MFTVTLLRRRFTVAVLEAMHVATRTCIPSLIFTFTVVVEDVCANSRQQKYTRPSNLMRTNVNGGVVGTHSLGSGVVPMRRSVPHVPIATAVKWRACVWTAEHNIALNGSHVQAHACLLARGCPW